MKSKLLNSSICQLFVVIGVLGSCVQCQNENRTAAENVTFYDRSFEKVLSRRKRFLVWRPGSNILLTASLVKPLAFPRPTGHNLILEWDIFYPLPSSWRVPKPPPPPPPPTTTTEAIEVFDPHDHDHDPHDHDHDPHDHDSGPIWMPDSGWTSDVVEKLNDDPAEKRFWNAPRPQQAGRREWTRNNLFRESPPSPVTQYRNPLLYQTPLQPTNTFYRNQKINPNQRYYQPSPSSPVTLAMNKQRQMNYARRGRFLGSDVVNDEPHGHRERRDLYKRIVESSPFGSFDVRSCLLRTMCEAQNVLYPPGYSLLQDTLRAIFTMPIKDGADDDDYAAAMQKDQDCVSIYSQKCPISILAFLLRSKN